MRVGVIRGDVPSPIFLADLEPSSQTNYPTESFGQTRYISRPDPDVLTNWLAGNTTVINPWVDGSTYRTTAPGLPIRVDQVNATTISAHVSTTSASSVAWGGVPAAIQGTAISFPVNLADANVLMLATTAANLTADTFVTVTIGTGTSYASMTLLLAAANLAMAGSGFSATTDSTGTKFVIQSTTPGVGSYVAVGLVADGSTADTPLNLTPDSYFLMPTAATIIAALNPQATPPATGSIDVSAATILTNLGASPAAALVADFIAPKFQETEVALQSFQVGNLSKFRSLTWTPDSRRLPVITAGPAIEVVEDDGVTAFTSAANAPLPMITAAAHNTPATGDITITGVGLGNVEAFSETVVVVTAAAGTNGTPPEKIRLTQKQITSTITDGVALTGTFNVTNGSATVTTSIDHSAGLHPGNSIVFASQPNTVYTVSTVVTTTVTLTSVYTGISNSLTIADTPVTQGVVSATSIVIPAVLLKTALKTALGVAGSTVEVKFESFANSNYGTTAKVGAPSAAGVSAITNILYQNAALVGSYITLSGAAAAANNGTFPIVGYTSATAISILNYNAVADATGNIVWSEPAPVAFVVT